MRRREDESDLQVAAVISNGTEHADCAVAHSEPSNDVYPHVKTIDYGTGCTDDWGVTRSGKKMLTIYADVETATAGQIVSYTTYSDYSVNGVSITGGSRLSIVSPASSGTLIFKVIESESVSDGSGNNSSYVSLTIHKRTEGGGTEIRDDDVYEITSNTTGTAVNGDSAMVVWKSQTDPNHPVINRADCDFRSEGVVNINLTHLGTETKEVLDYGNGDCDNDATLSINGEAAEHITLPFFPFATHL